MPHSQPSFTGSVALFGADPTEGIIAVEPIPGAMRRYRRIDGSIQVDESAWRVPVLVSESALLEGGGFAFDVEPLEGDGTLRHVAWLDSWDEVAGARRHLRQVTRRSPSSPDAPYLVFNDPMQAYLVAAGQTLFKGMRFGDVARMQVDIETASTPGFDFPNAQREGDRIVAIAMSDSSGWEEVLVDTEGDEKGLLQEFIGRVEERDPDVIEGHNIFRFDLPYIAARCRRHRVRPALGRNGGVMKSRASRATIGERTINYPKAEIPGRHVIDTYFLVLHYDIATRSLPGFGLKQVARHFGLAAEDREYIDGDELCGMIDLDPDRLRRYAADDVRETRALADLLSPSWFVQAQILPYSYQTVVVRGNATRIDTLLVREYLRRRRAVPLAESARSFAGGYTDLFEVGVAHGVWHCDVQSLYPSVMLRFGYAPARDDAGVFLELLGELREFRLDAKRSAREAGTDAERDHYDALQSTFKILINSFYGYLGFSQGHFNDYSAAEQVTGRGREILRRMIEVLREEGCRIIEIDTDGIYFLPPQGDPDAVEKTLADALRGELPDGIEVDFDGRFQAMFSYKMKNYALLDDRGRLSIKGAALKSRGLEPFQRRFMEEMLRRVLEGLPGTVPELYEEYCQGIEAREWPIREFTKTETLQDSIDTYRDKIEKKKRNRGAAYELALASDRDYRQGDQVAFYIAGTEKRPTAFRNAKMAAEFDLENRDENVDYYLGKLRSLYRKFAPFFAEEGAGMRPVERDEPAGDQT